MSPVNRKTPDIFAAKKEKMIHARLYELEENIGKQHEEAAWKLKIIRRFREWLRQVDRSAEMIPVNDPARLHRLLASLKGKSLTAEEKALVGEIVNRQE